MVRMPHWPKPFWYNRIQFGFERIAPLLNALDNPHLKMPPAIHVSGTNGKGSTLSYIRYILETAGYSVHTYISPHIVRFNERIVLAGKEISDEYLYNIMERTRLAEMASGKQVTFFEGTTAAAFLAFSEHPADFLIMETGMGGRLDATNMVENKLINVIASISYDHMEFLGDTLSKIATEKSGIMRPNLPTIVAAQTEEVIETLSQQAAKINCPTSMHGEDFGLSFREDGVYYVSDAHEFKMAKPGLEGDHQYLNAAAAITAILNLNLGINYAQINEGLKKTSWPGRLQQITSGNLRQIIPDDWEVWIDGAHNPGGGQILGVWAYELQQQDPKPLYAILGITRNRDVPSLLQFLAPSITKAFTVYVEDEASSYKSEVLAEKVAAMGIPAEACESLEEAVEKISKEPGPARILLCGSLFLAGMFLRKNGEMAR
ncbi:bifunctional folylpolyglutamate synthase/dihydrofolate synthase [Rickettsiales endosymbiont of Stachyamoeba lipophora]|uniref:bifunctional folylpolyglutamate synthase/dihydrofolate synthase n=1 Tax=Rickettsiales endosymbiont of Stachyamoeba lipophora TaxID=2486578 RepID=UPI000F647D4B|nr:folylpolyglutamate synthase/dihydrofolate synthase family protein [Rickettsiales endosymbiont of Stachyamoeba lipophora]AZL15234.1 bifunctional folylpolyglutamate synthase/dihydrofolate synthase [Rickettsiales endosymbiont of Stachyamoeba lipophora]